MPGEAGGGEAYTLLSFLRRYTLEVVGMRIPMKMPAQKDFVYKRRYVCRESFCERRRRVSSFFLSPSDKCSVRIAARIAVS